MNDGDGSQYYGCCEVKATSKWKLKMNDGSQGQGYCEGEEDRK